jgi:hypothetical protein
MTGHRELTGSMREVGVVPSLGAYSNVGGAPQLLSCGSELNKPLHTRELVLTMTGLPRTELNLGTGGTEPVSSDHIPASNWSSSCWKRDQKVVSLAGAVWKVSMWCWLLGFFLVIVE